MKVYELMSMADEYLNADKRKRKAKIKCLEHVLDKLSKREKKLDLKCEEGRGNKEKISNEITLIHAHRKKGIKLLKQLVTERKEAKEAKKMKQPEQSKKEEEKEKEKETLDDE